jgi:mannose-1-phosphate guanylyltransferase
MYVTILAGGGGTRLWPLSRQSTPKQFLQLFSSRTMLQTTVDRVRPLTAIDQIFVVTAETYVADTRAQLPEIEPAHVIGEPRPRNSAMAIGLAATYIANLDPDALMASVGSDHLIRDAEGFRQTLRAGAEAASRADVLVTIGITPTEPHTGYGYIRAGAAQAPARGMDVRKVEGFKEKPDRETAERYIATGQYYWNTNYFLWRASAILAAFDQYAPDMAEGLRQIRKAIGSPHEAATLVDVYANARTEAVDTAILEKASNLLVIPATFDWSDVGSWSDLYQVAESQGGNAILQGPPDQHLDIESEGCLIFPGDHLIATIGLKDVVVVHTPDVTLVCAKDRAQDVKKLVEELQRTERQHFL